MHTSAKFEGRTKLTGPIQFTIFNGHLNPEDISTLMKPCLFPMGLSQQFPLSYSNLAQLFHNQMMLPFVACITDNKASTNTKLFHYSFVPNASS